MSQIADQLQIRKTTFKNRIIKGAMSEALANTAGQPNQLHLGLYEAWAKGGLGCAITGNVMVDIRAKMNRAWWPLNQNVIWPSCNSGHRLASSMAWCNWCSCRIRDGNVRKA